MASLGSVDLGWLEGPIHDVLERISSEIEADAKATCPVDTGELRASLDHEVDGHVARIGSNVHYAGFVEEGHRIVAWGHDTHRMQPPQPYLRPALYVQRG